VSEAQAPWTSIDCGKPAAVDDRGPKYVVGDWRGHDLQPPPAGYQWLQIDGDFVLAAIGTGVITGILSGPHH